MQGFNEILEYVLNLSVFSKPTMVAMDSYVVKDAKYQYNKAEKESENRVQDISRSVEELIELVFVSLKGNDIKSVCQAHVEVAFYEEFLTHFKEIVKLISSVWPHAKCSELLAPPSISLCYCVTDLCNHENDNDLSLDNEKRATVSNHK